MPPQKLILTTDLCPGDVLTLTAAVESLHQAYPDEYLTDVRTPCPAIWEHNPRITPIRDDDPDARRIECHYPTVNVSNQHPVTFLSGYTTHLGEQLSRPLTCRVNRPQLFLSPAETSWMDQLTQHFTNGRKVPFWLLNAGIKDDYTAKAWPVEHFADVVRLTAGRVQWVQVGAREHDHPQLPGVVDLRGKTDHRQLIRLAYHARGGLGPVTYLQHLCAAWQRPYLCLLGGREPLVWTQYPLQHTFATHGALPCCRNAACWKSKVVPTAAHGGRTAELDAAKSGLCELPVIGMQRPVAKCMAMIRPTEVVSVLERFLCTN